MPAEGFGVNLPLQVETAAAWSPIVIGLVGLPGSGKTRAAVAIQQHLNGEAVIISRDDLRRTMFPMGTASTREKSAAFNACLARAGEALTCQCSVILDGCTFAREADRALVRDLAERHGCRVVWIHMACGVDTARERIARDVLDGSHSAPDRIPDLVLRVAAAFDPPPPEAVTIDADRPWGEVEAKLRLACSDIPASCGGSLLSV